MGRKARRAGRGHRDSVRFAASAAQVPRHTRLPARHPDGARAASRGAGLGWLLAARNSCARRSGRCRYGSQRLTWHCSPRGIGTAASRRAWPTEPRRRCSCDGHTNSRTDRRRGPPLAPVLPTPARWHIRIQKGRRDTGTVHRSVADPRKDAHHQQARFTWGPGRRRRAAGFSTHRPGRSYRGPNTPNGGAE
jgi:hypothetical protein